MEKRMTAWMTWRTTTGMPADCAADEPLVRAPKSKAAGIAPMGERRARSATAIAV
jgi:hypothetical protein